MDHPTSEAIDLSQVTLAVLAGGSGSRMGLPKAWLQVGSQSILAWHLQRLNWLGPTMLVSSPATAQPPDAALFQQQCLDPFDGLGPLQGLLTALDNLMTPLIVTMTVDMPLFDREKLAWYAHALDNRPDCLALMGQVHANGIERIEPFPAIFRREAAAPIRERLQQGRRSVQGLCDDPRFCAIAVPLGWPETVWTNLNEPAQFKAFERQWQQQAHGQQQ